MNCKQGDLAIVMYSGLGNEGKIVRCVTPMISSLGNAGWYVDIDLGPCYGILDACLRPIRDTDGQDETLTWKDVPHKEVA